jgi:hypothetical protein
MAIFWYYCKQCGIKFSWVFTGIKTLKADVKADIIDVGQMRVKKLPWAK